MARTKPAEQRRADLLAAAQNLFVTKGLGATTLEDITSGAGVSQGLFYHYFRSKEDIVWCQRCASCVPPRPVSALPSIAAEADALGHRHSLTAVEADPAFA